MTLDIQALIDKYGPVVVAAAQQQVRVAIAQDVLWGLMGLAFLIVSVKLTRRAIAGYEDDYNSDKRILTFIGAGITGVIAFIMSVNAWGEVITFTLNPTWATIQMVTKLVK